MRNPDRCPNPSLWNTIVTLLLAATKSPGRRLQKLLPVYWKNKNASLFYEERKEREVKDEHKQYKVTKTIT